MNENIAAAKAALSHLEIDENPAAIKAKSRDFFWYSPVLKDRLDHVVADFVVAPKNEDEVIEVLKTCYAHDCPVTTRGAGTGNYGQAMPLAGGCVMHLKHMNAVKEIHPGRVITEPGQQLIMIPEITEPYHATACLSIINGIDNGLGVTGIVPEAQAYFFPLTSVNDGPRELTAWTSAIMTRLRLL